MPTSANVIEYTIKKDGEKVGKHYQNILCKPKWGHLLCYQPLAAHTITPWGYDEEEEYWEGEEQNLADFVEKLEKLK